MDDLFLKIISGDIPSVKIYEDEHTYAFLDIRPINKGHTLVVPKAWSRNVLDVDPATLSHIAITTQKVARALKQALGAEGITLVMNNDVGQEVYHTHMHVIPRFVGDNAFTPPHHATYTEGEQKETAESIRNALT